MPRSMIAGDTDYDHQSFQDMLADLRDWVSNLTAVLEYYDSGLKSLEQSGYWRSVDPNVIDLFGYAQTFYQTSLQEITAILKEMPVRVENNHVARLKHLGRTAIDLNRRFGKVWHQDFRTKPYHEPEFQTVEHLYCKGRDMAVDMMDLGNLAFRLEDFVGMQTNDKTASISSGISNSTSNLWKSGLFFLLLFAVIIAGIGVLALIISPWVLAITLTAGVLFVIIVGALVLRSQGEMGLSQKNFVALILRTLKLVPLLRKESGEDQPKTNSTDKEIEN